MDNLFFWIIAALLVGMGGFTGYANWKLYFEAKKMREHVLKTHQSAKVIRLGQLRIWMYAAMAAVCMALGIMMLVMEPASQAVADARYSQAVVYFGLAVFAFAMFGEALTDSEVIQTPDAFLYEATLIRYRDIRTVTVAKGWFKSSMIVLSGAKEIPVSKKTAYWVEQELETWKKERKSTFKNRKERRMEARKKREGK